jgi:Transglycosylase SLT domain
MADDLEKFVLRYEVDSKEATKRLEQLEKQVGKTNSTFKGAHTNASRFARGAVDEFNKAIPGIRAVNTVITEMAAGFGVAAVAVSALALAIKSVSYARDQYNIRRLTEQTSGLGFLTQEDLVRKFQGANVTREQAQGIFGKAAGLLTGARKDISGGSKDWYILTRDLGLTRDATTQDVLAAFASKPAIQAQAIGKAAGFSIDEINAIQKVGPAGIRNNDLTADTVKNMEEGDKAAQKLNEDLAALTKNFQALELNIGETLLPLVSGLVNIIHDPKAEKEAQNRVKNAKGFFGMFSAVMSNMGIALGGVPSAEETAEAQEPKKSRRQQEVDAKRAAADKALLDEKVNAQNKEANDKKIAQDREDRSIALFSAAVATFAQAMNPEQARAALIGEIGARSGVGSSRAGISLSSGKVVSMPGAYKADIDAVRAKYGNNVADLLSAQISVESGWDPTAKNSSTSASGIAQITDATRKTWGLGEPDPHKDIAAAGAATAKYLKMTGGDLARAAMLYNQGPGYKGPNTGYASKVLSAYAAGQPVFGPSIKSDVFRTQADTGIAKLAGVTVDRLSTVNKADMATFGAQQISGLNKQIMILNNQINARSADPDDPNAIQATKKQINEWYFQRRQAQNQLSALNVELPRLIGAAAEGEAYQTQGVKVPLVGEINIQITEAQDPKGTARKAIEGIKDGSASFINNNSSSNKS